MRVTCYTLVCHLCPLKQEPYDKRPKTRVFVYDAEQVTQGNAAAQRSDASVTAYNLLHSDRPIYVLLAIHNGTSPTHNLVTRRSKHSVDQHRRRVRPGTVVISGRGVTEVVVEGDDRFVPHPVPGEARH